MNFLKEKSKHIAYLHINIVGRKRSRFLKNSTFKDKITKTLRY